MYMANIGEYRQIITSLDTLDASLNLFQTCINNHANDRSLNRDYDAYFSTNPDITCANANNITLTVLNTQITNEIGRLSKIDSPIGLIAKLNSNISTDHYNTTNTNYDSLKTRYEELQKLRRRLDLKAQELYNNRNSGNDIQMLTDSAIYGTLLWTILATSLVYYIFIKM